MVLLKIKVHIVNAFNNLRKYGILSFLRALINYFGFQCFDRSLIFHVCNLEQIPGNRMQKNSFSHFTVEDIESGLYDYDDGFFTKIRAIYRLKCGHQLCVVKLDNHKLASYAWIEHHNATVWWFDDLPVDMPRDMVLFSAEYTPPEFRNRGIAHLMLTEILHCLKEKGIKRALAVVHPQNLESLKLQRWLGFKDYQIIRYRRLWLIRHYTITKSNSSESVKMIRVFSSPRDIWKMFLPLK